MNKSHLLAALIGLGALCAAPACFAAGETPPELAKTLPASKHTLVEAIQQIAKSGETPTAAKFEYEDGALHLAVYASAKGLKLDAEHNVLKEHKGNPLDASWKPGVEIFKDVEHVSRAAEYHALMELSPYSLLEIATKARALGTPIWVTPYASGGKGFFEVGIFKNGTVSTVKYGLLDGKQS